MSDSNEGSGHQRRRRRNKSSSRRSHKEESSDHPRPVMLSQAEQDERVKRKMAEADNIANRALAVPNSTTPRTRKKKKKISNSMVDRDEKLKRKMAQADRITSSLLLDNPHSLSTIDEDSNASLSSASYLAASKASPTVNQERPAVPLEPSTRRVSKQRNSVVMTPGAYAIEGFNEASSSQDLIPDEELTDQLVFEDDYDDDEDSMGSDEMNGLVHEEFEDEIIQGSGSRRMSRSSGILSSGRFSAGNGRVSSSGGGGGGGGSQVSSVRFSLDGESVGSGNGQEIFEADVILAVDADEEEESGKKLTEKKRKRRRIIVGALVVMCLITAVIVTLCLTLNRDSSNDDSPTPSDEQLKTTQAPTLPPTISPAPSFSTVPVTIIIRFDDNTDETGWVLECDGATIDSIPAGSYFDSKAGDVISETARVQEGADCKFIIFDLESDGLCCEYGRGFYQVYLAEEDEVPNGFVAEGSAFQASETVEFTAVASENS